MTAWILVRHQVSLLGGKSWLVQIQEWSPLVWLCRLEDNEDNESQFAHARACDVPTHLIDVLVCFDEVNRELPQWSTGRVSETWGDPPLEYVCIRNNLQNTTTWHTWLRVDFAFNYCHFVCFLTAWTHFNDKYAPVWHSQTFNRQVTSQHIVPDARSITYIGSSNARLRNIVGCLINKAPCLWKIKSLQSWRHFLKIPFQSVCKLWLFC